MTPRSPAADPVPAYARLGPVRAASPLVVAVPHAGRHYPEAIERDRAVGWETLTQLEDRYADRLIGPLLDAGAVAVVAGVARAWIDLNRGEREICGMAGDGGARARAGLGLVPSRLAGRPLWRREPEAAEVERRLATVHRPYHAAIARALAEAQAAHGFALLLDCHSMPSLGTGVRTPRLVIGDRRGGSAASAASRAALAAASAGGQIAALNAPYAGAHTLARHGRPEHGVHALQIEVDRSLYLDSRSEPVAEGVAAIAACIAAIGRAAMEAVSPLAMAAE